MTMFAVQTFLLILAAFLAGAMVACFVRRIFFMREHESHGPSGGQSRRDGDQSKTHTVGSVTASAATTSAVTASPSTTAASSDGSRFDRALQGGTSGTSFQHAGTKLPQQPVQHMVPPVDQVSAVPNTVSTPEPDLEPTYVPEAPTVIEPVVQDNDSVQEADAAKNDTRAVASDEQPKPVAQNYVHAAKVAAMISPALAAAIPAHLRDPVPANDDTATNDVSGTHHAVEKAPSPTAELEAAAAPVARDVAAQTNNEGIDELTRIQGIDYATAQRLRASGVSALSQIAVWRPEDVQRMNQSLGLFGRIEKERWIEQAQHISGVVPAPVSAPASKPANVVQPKPAAPAAVSPRSNPPAPPNVVRQAPPRQMSPVVSKGPLSLTPSRFAPRAERDLSVRARPAAPVAARKFVAPLSLTPSRFAPVGYTQVAQVSEPTTVFDSAAAPVSPAAPIQSANQTSETEHGAGGNQPSDVRVLRSVRSKALLGVTTGPTSNVLAFQPGDVQVNEDLKRIRGIGVLIEKKLNAMGIRTYAQIANWTADDIARVSAKLDFKGRIERENWIEQARILTSGGYTEFSRRSS